MGSVALLTREGEVEIAKEIEEGEKEIILSSLSSSHALKEIVKLKEKVEAQENQNEYIKDLVRGLDDESSNSDIKKTGVRIFEVCDRLKSLLSQIEAEDGTLKKFSSEQTEEMTQISHVLADLTFNRKIINSFVEPVKSTICNSENCTTKRTEFLNFSKLKIVKNIANYVTRSWTMMLLKEKYAKHLFTTDAKIEQLIRNEEDVLRKFRRLSIEAGMDYDDIEKVYQIISKGEAKADKAKAELVEANLRLVVSIAKKYTNRGTPVFRLNSRGQYWPDESC